MKNIVKLFALVIAVSSCSDVLSIMGYEKKDPGETKVYHEMIVLGDQLEDPYSVENMTKALETLYPTKAGRVALNTTNLYVRFLPEEDSQLKLLESMGLTLLDHPVDFEIVREGDYYHDPEVDKDAITWQYAVVDKDFEFPADIKYEILDKCYIPSEEAGTKSGDIDWEAVERESFLLTGNGALVRAGTSGSGKPKGRITILDEAYSDEPVGVAGVRVSCNLFVKFANCYTDEDGYYEMDRIFTSEPRYRLVFKNENGFAIGMNLILVQASVSTMGKGSVEGVSLEVTKDSDRSLFTRCVVNNAGYDYCAACKETDNMIALPPANLRLWILKDFGTSMPLMLQQGVGIDNTIVGDYLGEYSFLLKMLLPDVILGLKGKNDYPEIYAEALHQFAHASHFVKVTASYWNKLVVYLLKSFITSGFVQYGTGTEADHGYCEIAEMWAYYAQTKLYQARYPDSDTLFGTNYWFSPQILFFLDERGFGMDKIFSVLSEDIADTEMLQHKLHYIYPENASIINQAFMRYN
ncbi:MAG: hypothetical protein MJY46_05245 [Bacteroidales bacterium]|nr:hypothetical protein [Bacteroidales bacterium]